MCKKIALLLAAIALMIPTQAHAWPVRIGIGIGIPIGGYWGPGYYRPYYGYGPYYGGYPYYPGYPAPVVVGAPPVVVQQPGYAVQPGMVAGTSIPTTPPVVVGSPPPPPQPAPYNPISPAGPVSVAPSSPGLAAPVAGPQLSQFSQAGASQAGVDTLLQRMNQSEEHVRRDAIMDLGRMRAYQAIDPLTNVLSTDSSPVVRDAAARALGLIGNSRALPALIRAAQADNDRDVRHSAQFAIEIIRSQMQR